jgi:hypothetical protein
MAYVWSLPSALAVSLIAGSGTYLAIFTNPKQTLFTKLFDEKSGMSYSDIIQEARGYIVAGMSFL